MLWSMLQLDTLAAFLLKIPLQDKISYVTGRGDRRNVGVWMPQDRLD